MKRLIAWELYLFYYFQNYPLFVRTSNADNELKFCYTVHTSLDVVEEKISSVGKNTNDMRELYLGLLYPTEDYKVYPFIISVHIIIVVASPSSQLRDVHETFLAGSLEVSFL